MGYRMGFVFHFFILGSLLLSFPALTRGAELSLDGFGHATVGEFPPGWRTYPFQMDKAKRVYKIEQEGNSKFLRAVDEEQLSATIVRPVKWDVKKYPYLKFRWRAQQIPNTKTTAKRPINDHACGVYVAFGRSSGMKYVWSSALSEGSYWAKDPGNYVIISSQYGSGGSGQWQNESVNVPADFEKYLGKPLEKNPNGIAILTDADNSKQKAACDYADIRISDQP